MFWFAIQMKKGSFERCFIPQHDIRHANLNNYNNFKKSVPVVKGLFRKIHFGKSNI
jgi:hypothetical protein